MNPLTVRIFNDKSGMVVTHFLDMCMSSLSTAEGIFSKMEEVLVKHSIPWKYCVGIGLDNTSVNMGCRNSIRSRIETRNPAVSVIGCPCHIVHNIATKAGEAYQKACWYSICDCIYYFFVVVAVLSLMKVLKFNVEEMVIDIYYWFDRSTKRKASLLEYCNFCDTSYRNIVKHVNTRWLSFEKAVCRILQQYAVLRRYYLSEGIVGMYFNSNYVKLIHCYRAYCYCLCILL